MATASIRLFGSTFKWNTKAIAESVEIGFPGINTETIDVSSEDSASAFREFLAGMHDGGEFTVDANFIKGDTDGQRALMTDAAAGTAREAIITLYGGATWTVTAICTKVQPSGAMTEQQKISFTFKVTGIPVFAATASANITTLVYTDSVGVKTSLPVFAGGTYLYSVTIATASTWIKLTVTDATAATISAVCLGVEHLLTSAAISEQIIVGAAGTTTLLTLTVTDTGEVPVVYTIYVVRP